MRITHLFSIVSSLLLCYDCGERKRDKPSILYKSCFTAVMMVRIVASTSKIVLTAFNFSFVSFFIYPPPFYDLIIYPYEYIVKCFNEFYSQKFQYFRAQKKAGISPGLILFLSILIQCITGLLPCVSAFLPAKLFPVSFQLFLCCWSPIAVYCNICTRC